MVNHTAKAPSTATAKDAARRLPLPAGARPELLRLPRPDRSTGPSPVPVVIPAHNEAAVLDRCLGTLLADARPGEFDVVVVANGCTDTTAALARAAGVRAVEIDTASKPAALNAGDAIVRGHPRVYLDADVRLSTAGLRALVDAVRQPGRCAATCDRRLDLAGRPLLVRAFYAVNSRLPVYRRALFGRGVVALSEAGRRRFGRFPDGVAADDLFLDALFSEAETAVVAQAEVLVATPRRTRDLVRRLAAIRAGNAALRRADPQIRRARPLSWLRDVVLTSPRLAPAAGCYVGIVLAAELRRRADRLRGRAGWGRDESSRLAGAR